MGICSSDGMMLFNITKEAFAWGKKENAKADMGRFPPQHSLKARWKSDATTPVRFLVPPVWNYNLDVPSYSDHMHYSLEVSTVPYVKKIKRKHKKGGERKYWY
ncbi:PROCT domain protein [Raphanus sativus]|nr:PROCT domain protein [Raphanus sativus]